MAQRPVAVGDAELAEQVSEVVRQSSAPVPVKALTAALRGPKPPVPALRRVLARLVAERSLYRVKVVRTMAYTASNPEDQVRPALLEVARAGPLTADALQKATRRAVPGSSQRATAAAFQSLLEAGQLHLHPPVGTWRAKRYAVHPPDPSLYLAAHVAQLKALEAALRACGVARETWRAALAQALELEGREAGPGGSSPAVPAPPSDQAVVLEAVRLLAARQPSGAALDVTKVRELTSLAKARFDAALLGLREARAVSLLHHDFPQSLPPEQREALVADEGGVHYVAVVLQGGR
jgi:hypothetical protein